jgi:hypothetical protein
LPISTDDATCSTSHVFTNIYHPLGIYSKSFDCDFPTNGYLRFNLYFLQKYLSRHNCLCIFFVSFWLAYGLITYQAKAAMMHLIMVAAGQPQKNWVRRVRTAPSVANFLPGPLHQSSLICTHPTITVTQLAIFMLNV